MKLSELFILILFSIGLTVSAQYTDHELLLKKTSKFDIFEYKFYQNLDIDRNFKQLETSDKIPYFKSSGKEQTIKLHGTNIGRIVVYSRLFKNNDSIPNNGELRIRAYRKNIKKPILTLLKSFEYDTNQEFHYNFTSPGIYKVELTFSNDDNNYWVIEKLKVSELNQNGIDIYKNIETALIERQNLKKNWKKIRNNDKIRITNAIAYIRKQNEFVAFLKNKLLTDKLEKTRNSLYNPTNNSSFETELNDVFANASISNVDDFKNDYESIKKGEWSNALMNIDQIFTGGKFQSLIGLIGKLFNNGKYKAESNKDYVYTQVNKTYYAAEFKNSQKLTFRPIVNNNTDKVPFSKIKMRQDKIRALQQYVLVLKEFQLQDLQKQEKFKSQVDLAKNELQKLKNAWVSLVVTIDSTKIYSLMEKKEISEYLDNDVLSPMTICTKLEEYENYFSAISEFDKEIISISSRLLTLASKIKNFNDEYYLNVYRNIENQNGRISIINNIENLPSSISNRFEKDALRLQNEYQIELKSIYQGFTTITYSE